MRVPSPLRRPDNILKIIGDARSVTQGPTNRLINLSVKVVPNIAPGRSTGSNDHDHVIAEYNQDGWLSCTEK